MSMPALSCPYCNARVVGPVSTASGQRVVCPRCGETFPFRTVDGNPTEDWPGAASSPGPLPCSDAPPPTRVPTVSNRLIAGVVVAVMLGMGAIGLLWALKTVPYRRSHDRKEPVGYLPADCDLVIGVHGPRTLEAPEGRDLVREFDRTLADAGLPPFEKWTGLRWEDIEQAFLGMKLADRIFPRVVLVVETRDTYDANQVRAALRCGRPLERGDRTLYPFTLDRPGLPMELWCPSETMLLVGVKDDLDAVPVQPHPGVDHLPAWLQALLRDQTGADAQAWLLAHQDHWNETLALLPLPAAERQLLPQLRTLAFWLRLDQDIQLRTAVRCSNAAAAEELKDYLVQRDLVERPAVEVKKDVWVTSRVQTSAGAIRQRLEGGLGKLPWRKR